MRKTSTCPKCEQPIALIDAPDNSRVECPLCQEQFELSEALASAIEQEEGDSPPELTLVEKSDDGDLGSFFASLAEDDTPEEGADEARASEQEASEKDEDLEAFFANMVDEEPTEDEPSEKQTDDESTPEQTPEQPGSSEDTSDEDEPDQEDQEEDPAPILADQVGEDSTEAETFEDEVSDEDTPEEAPEEPNSTEEPSETESSEDEVVEDEEEKYEEADGTEAGEEPSEEDTTEDEDTSDAEETGEEDSEEDSSDDLTLAEEPPAQVRCPCCMESFDLDDLLLAETNQALGKEAASAILADGSVREPAESGMKFNFGGVAADEDHSGFQLASSAESPSASPGAFEFASAVGENGDSAEKSVAARAQRRGRDRGIMKDMVGAIFGGAAGLLITYYCLNLFGGPRFDWLDVYLPFVKHTAVHRPGWLGGPPESEEEEFDSGLGEGLDLGLEPPKPAPEEPKPKKNEKQHDTPPAEEPADKAVEEPMPPEEKPVSPSFVGVLDQPAVTSDDLGKALRKIDELREAGPLTEEGYEEWCRAAEAATFLDPKDGEPQTRDRLTVMRRLMKEMSVADVTNIGRFATQRTINPDRSNNGILFAGTAGKSNVEKGKGYMTALRMAGTGSQIIIASDHKLPLKPEDRVCVVGYLVDNPKEATEGLDTELAQIVWVRTVVKFAPRQQ